MADSNEREAAHTDPLLSQAQEIVRREGSARGPALLQRRLRISRGRAVRLLQELDAEGLDGTEATHTRGASPHIRGAGEPAVSSNAAATLMAKAAATVLIIVVVVVGIGGFFWAVGTLMSPRDVAAELQADYGGRLVTYRQILGMNDCGYLELAMGAGMQEFIRTDAESDEAIGYVNAARIRMEELDC